MFPCKNKKILQKNKSHDQRSQSPSEGENACRERHIEKVVDPIRQKLRCFQFSKPHKTYPLPFLFAPAKRKLNTNQEHQNEKVVI